MSWWMILLLFGLNILDDGLAVLWVRRTAQGKAMQAALLSGLLTLVISFSVIQYIQNSFYLAPIILGSMVGTFLTIKFDGGNNIGKRW